MDCRKWWPLSAAICWIALKKPLPFSSWPNDVALNDFDDVVEKLKEAVGDGDVRARGRGPYILHTAPYALKPEQTPPGMLPQYRLHDADRIAIPAEHFTPNPLAFLLASEGIGPSEDARDLRDFRRWDAVEISAEDMRRKWPDAAVEMIPVGVTRSSSDIAMVVDAPHAAEQATRTPLDDVSADAARREFAGRVSAWKASGKSAPTERADSAWIKHRYPSAPRKFVRELRAMWGDDARRPGRRSVSARIRAKATAKT